EEIERLASGLRDSTMGVRMVPMGSLFGRFRRLVHDLSRDLGKPVDFVTVGEDTELDKTMWCRWARSSAASVALSTTSRAISASPSIS
ncbi:hypothetical protein AB4156_41190, partial [Cupriavidus sp. 2MCAB6]|uniref:hypothetical protein n=1 Tax=Cupriavidus sp. 2MCAB6 TaxID=3232981 RepID=UPI003F8E67B8